MSTHTAPFSIGLVGQIFADVSQQDLARALDHQAKHPQTRLGEAMIECGMLKPDTLEDLLLKQQELRENPGPHDVMRVIDYATRKTRNVAARIAELGDGED